MNTQIILQGNDKYTRYCHLMTYLYNYMDLALGSIYFFHAAAAFAAVPVTAGKKMLRCQSAMVSTDTKYNSVDINNIIIIAIQVYFTLYMLQNDYIS